MSEIKDEKYKGLESQSIVVEDAIKKITDIYNVNCKYTFRDTFLFVSIEILNNGMMVCVYLPYESIAKAFDKDHLYLNMHVIFNALKSHLENEWIAVIKK